MSLSHKMSLFFCHFCHLLEPLDFTGFKRILSPLSPKLTKFFIGGLSWYKPQLFVLAFLSSTNSPRPQNIEGASSPSERLGEHERLRLSHSPLIGCLLEVVTPSRAALPATSVMSLDLVRLSLPFIFHSLSELSFCFVEFL